jgi:hypothetical protein
VDITIANAQEISATVVRAGDRLSDVTAVIGGQIFLNLPSAPNLLSSNSKFELFGAVAQTGEPVTGTCAVSGTVTVSGAPENDPVSLSPYDKFYLVFDTSDDGDGDGYTLDGNFSLFVSGVVGDPRTDVTKLTYSVRDMTLTIAAGADNYSASNGLLLVWNSLAFPVIVLENLKGAGLRLSSQADVFSWSDGRQSLTINADVAISATVSESTKTDMESTFLGGELRYETIAPLQAPDGQNSESGEILVSGGAGNETIRIVIESSTIVRLDIDSDGDNIVDDIQYTTWAALLG